MKTPLLFWVAVLLSAGSTADRAGDLGAKAFSPSRSVSRPPRSEPPPGAAPWRSWGASAAEHARKDAKPLCVLVSAFGCTPCRALERDLLAQEGLAARCVPVRVDADELPHIADALALLARPRGGPRALPLLVALATDGRLLDVAPAPQPATGGGPEPLRRWLEGVARPGAPAPPPLATAVPALAEGDPAEALAALAPPDDDGGADPLQPLGLPALRARTEDLTRASPPEQIGATDRLLERAARSGYRDHVGGGFHRARLPWTPPALRYEKRLADNALWLRAFARGYAATGNLLQRDVCQQTVAWALREMRDATGGFWSTVDAASGGEDGAFYRFTRGDVEAALGPERTAEFLAVYDVQPPGLFRLGGTPFAGLGPSIDVLRARRARRVRPAPDERILAGWNGLFIGALAVSGQKLRRGSDLEAARRAADTVLKRLGPPASLKHSTGAHAAGGPAALADYAYLAEGLLDLEAATGERRWRERAIELVDAALLRLWVPSAGAFRGGEEAGPLPAAALRSARDGDLPAPHGVMASVLVRLGALTGEPRYTRVARRLFETFAPEAVADRRASATLAAAARAFWSTAEASSKAPAP